MNSILLLIVIFGFGAFALCAIALAREIQRNNSSVNGSPHEKTRSNFDE